jgi:HSP20 family protein
MDVVERDDAYEIIAEMPGLDEKNVEIKLSSGNLVIKGKKEEKEKSRSSTTGQALWLLPANFPHSRGRRSRQIDANFKKGC